MSSLIRWSPLTDLASLHSAMDRLFSDTFSVGGGAQSLSSVGEGYLPIDIYQTEKDWVIRAAVPGIDPQAVEVTFAGGTITIKGEIKAPEGPRPENFWLRENFYGKFSRQVTLPEDARGEQARARFKSGVLELTVPKAQPVSSKSVKIPVTGASAHAESSQLETSAKK